MERIPRQFFTNEFKEEAVKLAVDGGLSMAEVGRRLSISPQTLKNWITKHQSGKLNAPGSRTVSELEAEISKLRKLGNISPAVFARNFYRINQAARTNSKVSTIDDLCQMIHHHANEFLSGQQLYRPVNILA